MILGFRRAILFSVIAMVALVITFYPLIVSVPQSEFEKVKIRLHEVNLLNNTTQPSTMNLRIVFSINNPTDKTLTTSKIDYELFADGISIGAFALSYENIPLNGRPALFPSQPVDLSSTIQLDEVQNQEILTKIKENASVRWKVVGTAQIETALTQGTKEFVSEI